MNIKKLFKNTSLNIEITGITANSKEVKDGYIFVAVKGKKTNGENYISEAIHNGAKIIVTEKKNYGPFFITVKDAKIELIRLLQIFYNYNLKIYSVGVTGTDGKTTVSTLLSKILDFRHSSAYIGTNGISYLDKHYDVINTTLAPEELYKAYNTMNQNKISDLVMEVSSEGILDKRIYDFSFHGAIFTNLTKEHLNTHHTMKDYFLCKMKLFMSLPKRGLAVINSDSPYAKYIKYYTDAKIITYGINSGMYQAKNIKLSEYYISYDITYYNHYITTVGIHLFGKYNAYNSLAAITYALELGLPIDLIKNQLAQIEKIDGRYEIIKMKNRIGIVDFCHTPNGLKCLLENIKLLNYNKIILVMGAAGEKDREKRPLMANIALDYADKVIFTSEDPKNENLFNIFYDLTRKIKKKDYYLSYFRRDAINLACNLSSSNDIIVVTGKGLEKVEKIKDISFKHSDLDILKECLNSL